MRLFSIAMILYGFIAFFAQGLAASGHLSFLPGWLEWPVLWPDVNVSDPSGNTLVGLPSGRVQVYDPGGRFAGGFFVAASGGSFKLRVIDPRHVEVLTRQERRRLVYSTGGALLERSTYAPASFDDIMTPHSAGRPVQSAWPLWPMAHPIVAWMTVMAGILGFVTSSHLGENRASRPWVGWLEAALGASVVLFVIAFAFSTNDSTVRQLAARTEWVTAVFLAASVLVALLKRL